MKRLLLPILLFMLFIPFYVNAEGYYLNNLKIDQKFMCGDRILYKTPNELLSSEEDTIKNIYGNFENGYGRQFIFEELSLSKPIVIQPGNGVYCPPSSCSVAIPCYPDGKDKYYKISKVEYDAEAFSIYFKAYESKPNLAISNYVNDSDKYFAKKDEILKYSVKIKNTGDGKSTDNVVITNVPNGLLVLEDQISDNGIYDKNNKTITWNYELLGAGAEYTFYYFTKVIDSKITEYTGNSYISSNQVQEKAESDDTIVNTENKIIVPDIIKNPNTETGIFIVLLTIILIISSSIYFIMKKRKDYILK